jgi:hypothetical protein
LSYSMPKTAVPVNSMLLCLASAVDSISTADETECVASEGLLTFKGSTDGGDYVLTLEEGSGNLAMFEMPNSNLIITFVNQAPLDTTTTTTLVSGLDSVTTTSTP